MPVTWDSNADARLLVGLLQTSNNKIDYDAVAKYVDPDCTPIAIKRRIERIKAKATAPASGEGDSSAPATPQKGKRGRPKKNAEAIEDEQNVSPKKKAKNGAVKGAGKEDGLSFGDA